MDDEHRALLGAYRADVYRRLASRSLIAVLCVLTALAVFGVSRKWTSRFERVFEPVPGLSYTPPPTLNGEVVLDVAEPLSFQKVSADEAYRFNASVPVSTEPLQAARPFILPVMAPGHAERALDCLTAAVYYEAASEGLAGQQAVAQVVLNRMRHPAFPNSVCGVVFSGSTRKTGCQFTFTCDGALGRKPSAGGWASARRVAQAALSGFVAPQVGHATHYHTLWVAPYWSPSLVKVANIGAHTFYRWKGGAGAREAFSTPYAGAEPVIALREAPSTPVTVEEAPIPPAVVVSPIEPAQTDLAAPPPIPSAPPAEARPVERREAEAAVAAPREAPPAPVTSPLAPPKSRPRLATPGW